MFTTKDGLASDRVFAIAAPDGSVWFGTWCGGISRYNGRAWTTFTTKDGLADMCVYQIAIGKDGTVWIATMEGGVSRYVPPKRTGF